MEGIIALIIIISALVKLNENSKKVRKNAPGQNGGGQQTAMPARPSTTPVRPSAPNGSFWEQIMMEFSESSEEETPVNPKPVQPKQASVQPKPSKKTQKHKGHNAVGSLAEGASRECEYGSLGGSMAYMHTDAEGEESRAISRPTADSTTEVYRPAMTAEEMRQAIVMAEILKTPQERMAEQARRWNLR